MARIIAIDMSAFSPRILYVRCERPLVYEVDHLRRIVREHSVDYGIFDSVAFGCDGPPEHSDVTSAYFRAIRKLGIGSLHIAHISRSAEDSERKPFGSSFWHNGFRATWFCKLRSDPGDPVLNVGFFNRKFNLGPLYPPTGFKVTFEGDRTVFSKIDPADNPDLAVKMSVRQRMAHLLQKGALEPKVIAEEIDAEIETIQRTVRRYKHTFTLLKGGQIALLQRSAS